MATTNKQRVQRTSRMLRCKQVGYYGADYEPASLANVAQSPSTSRAIYIPAHAVIGRPVHAGSRQEAKAATIALAHPDLLDLHEQRVIPVGPSPHPAAAHPLYRGDPTLLMPGIVDIASRMSCLSSLAKHQIPAEDGTTRPRLDALVGDLLPFIRTPEGVQCINWDVKKNAEDFGRPAQGLRQPRNPQRQETLARRRTEIEYQNYSAVGVPTIQVAGEDICNTLYYNIRSCLVGAARFLEQVDGNTSLVAELADACDEQFRDLIPPHQVWLHSKFSQIEHQSLTRNYWYYQVLRRQVPVELSTPLYLSGPLSPATGDPLEKYSDWFDTRAAA